MTPVTRVCASGLKPHGLHRHIAMRLGKRGKPNPFIEPEFVQKIKAGMWAKVEHPVRVLYRQFWLTKVRYRGPAESTAQIVTLFAPNNVWMAR